MTRAEAIVNGSYPDRPLARMLPDIMANDAAVESSAKAIVSHGFLGFTDRPLCFERSFA